MLCFEHPGQASPGSRRQTEAQALRVANRVEPDKKKAAEHFRKSLLYIDRGQYKNAMVEVTNAILRDPKNITYICKRGDLFELIGKYSNSARDFSRALNIVPQNGEDCFYRAYAFYNLNRYDEAVRSCDQAIKRKYTSQRVYKLKGKSFYKLDEIEKAIPFLKKSAELRPTVTGYLYLSRCSRRLEQLKQADKYVTKALKIGPNDPEALVEAAIVSYRLKNYKNAREFYVAFKKAAPKEALAYPAWQDFEAFCEIENKYDYYSKIIALSATKNAAPLYERSILSSSLGRYEAAAIDMEKFLKLSKWRGKSAIFAACYSVIFYRLAGKFHKAEEMLKLAKANLMSREWPSPIFLYLSSKLSENSLLLSAGKHSEKLTQAHYFIAMNNMQRNRVAEAEKQFAWVKKNGESGLDEFTEAVNELNRLRRRRILQGS